MVRYWNWNQKWPILFFRYHNYRVSHFEMDFMNWLWRIKIWKLDLFWRSFWNAEIGNTNVWCIKNRTKHSSKTSLRLVWFLMHQTLLRLIYFSVEQTLPTSIKSEKIKAPITKSVRFFTKFEISRNPNLDCQKTRKTRA